MIVKLHATYVSFITHEVLHTHGRLRKIWILKLFIWYGREIMKHILITYSNGDTERSALNGINSHEMLQGILDTDFECAWYSKRRDGSLNLITNMRHVRSIEVLGEDIDNLED